MTSNVGAERVTAKGGRLGFADQSTRGETRSGEELRGPILEDLKKVFRPEFLNRLDEAIVFRQLSRGETRVIAGRMLEAVAGRMSALGVSLLVRDGALDLLADQGFDPEYGARPLRRLIRAQVEDRAAELFLSGALSAGGWAQVDGADGVLTLSPAPQGSS